MEQVWNVMIRNRHGEEFSLLVTTNKEEAFDLFFNGDVLEEKGAIAAALLCDSKLFVEAMLEPITVH